MAIALVVALVGAGLLAGGAAGETTLAAPPHVQPEVPVTPTNQGLGLANNSPMLAADPDDARFVVMANRLDGPDFSCALQVSGDGGRSWLTATPVPALPEGAEKCYAPEVAFDRRGTIHYLFVGLAGRGNEPMGVFLTTSSDRGRTWSQPRQVLGPNHFGVRMAIDTEMGEQGRLHLVWLQATSDPPLGGFGPPPNPIMASYSDDGGDTFSSPVQVSDRERQLVVAPGLALGPDHAVYITYFDLGRDAVDYQGLEGPKFEGTWATILASSTDGGRHFGPGQVVDDRLVPSGRVMLIFTMPPPALVAHNRTVCLAWADARHGDDDVFLRCSEDQGQRWAPLQRVNDDPTGNGAAQYLPRLAFAPNGRLDAIFYDRRSDPSARKAQIFYTYSADHQRFAPNMALSQEPSDVRIGQRYAVPSAEGLVEFGSRLGLLARSRSALAAWPDTRHAYSPMISQDIFATEVQHVLPSSRTGVRLTGAALIVGGVVTASAVVFRRRRHDSGSE